MVVGANIQTNVMAQNSNDDDRLYLKEMLRIEFPFN
jgi:hypothetical protein